MNTTKTPITYEEAINFINTHDIVDGDEMMTWMLYIKDGVIMCHGEDDKHFTRFGENSDDPKKLNWYVETFVFEDGYKSSRLCATIDPLDKDFIFNCVSGSVYDKGSYKLQIRPFKQIWADYLLRDGKYDEYEEYTSKQNNHE